MMDKILLNRTKNLSFLFQPSNKKNSVKTCPHLKFVVAFLFLELLSHLFIACLVLLFIEALKIK